MPNGTAANSGAEGMRPYAGTLSIAEEDHAWITVDLSDESATGVSEGTWIVGGLSLALAIAAGVTTGFAADAHDRFRALYGMLQPAGAVADESTTFNLAADSLWIGAGIAALTAIVLLATTSDFEAQPSRAMVSRGGR